MDCVIVYDIAQGTYSSTEIGKITTSSAIPSEEKKVAAILRNPTTEAVFPVYVKIQNDGRIITPAIGSSFQSAVICGDYYL